MGPVIQPYLFFDIHIDTDNKCNVPVFNHIGRCVIVAIYISIFDLNYIDFLNILCESIVIANPAALGAFVINYIILY